MGTGVALVGAGMVAPTYLDAITGLPSVELRGVLAGHPDSARRLLDEHDVHTTVVYGSVAELTDDTSVEVVIVATPANVRREIVEAAATAGKHVLVEKPLERTLAAASELCSLCEQAGVTLGVMLQHRAKPVVADMHELIAEGELGRLVAAEVNVPWWRPQRYYDEPGRGSYARDGGGVLISQAIHTLDLALALAGPVSAVTALTATTMAHEMEAEDFVVAGLEFGSGALGSLFATTAAFPGRPETIRLHFAEGSATLRSTTLRVDWRDGTVDTFGTESATGAGADPMAFSADLHKAVIADFVDAIASGRAPLAPGRDTLAVHALIEAVEEAARSKRRVDLEGDGILL